MISYVAKEVDYGWTELLVCILSFPWLVLHLRMVTFSNNVEPANGFLVRYLHRKLMESEDEKNLTNEDLIRVLDWVPKLWYHLHAFLEKHSTSDFLIGMTFTLIRAGLKGAAFQFWREVFLYKSCWIVCLIVFFFLFLCLLRPLLLPVVSCHGWWVSIVVHWPLEPLYYSLPARGGQGRHQGEKPQIKKTVLGTHQILLYELLMAPLS